MIGDNPDSEVTTIESISVDDVENPEPYDEFEAVELLRVEQGNGNIRNVVTHTKGEYKYLELANGGEELVKDVRNQRQICHKDELENITSALSELVEIVSE